MPAAATKQQTGRKLSEWLDIMLAEIERKKQETAAAAMEQERREKDSLHDIAAPGRADRRQEK